MLPKVRCCLASIPLEPHPAYCTSWPARIPHAPKPPRRARPSSSIDLACRARPGGEDLQHHRFPEHGGSRLPRHAHHHVLGRRQHRCEGRCPHLGRAAGIRGDRRGTPRAGPGARASRPAVAQLLSERTRPGHRLAARAEVMEPREMRKVPRDRHVMPWRIEDEIRGSPPLPSRPPSPTVVRSRSTWPGIRI